MERFREERRAARKREREIARERAKQQWHRLLGRDDKKCSVLDRIEELRQIRIKAEQDRVRARENEERRYEQARRRDEKRIRG